MRWSKVRRSTSELPACTCQARAKSRMSFSSSTPGGSRKNRSMTACLPGSTRTYGMVAKSGVTRPAPGISANCCRVSIDHDWSSLFDTTMRTLGVLHPEGRDLDVASGTVARDAVEGRDLTSRRTWGCSRYVSISGRRAPDERSGQDTPCEQSRLRQMGVPVNRPAYGSPRACPVVQERVGHECEPAARSSAP